ncbi:Serine-threonine kinase receptor-associated protein [Entamoeba marina]
MALRGATVMKNLLLKIRLTREGDYFISCSADKTAMLWKLNRVEAMGVYTCTGAVSDCAITNDGLKVYFSSRDGSLFCYELETGKQLTNKLPIEKCYAPIKGLELSPNNDKLLTVFGGFRQHFSSVYTLDPNFLNKPVCNLSQEVPAITKALWLSNDNFIAGDELGFIMLRDTRTPKDGIRFESHKGEITDIACDINDILLGTTSKDGKSFVHDIRNTKDVISSFEAGYPLQSIAFAPYTDYYAVGGGQERSMITMTQRDMTMLMTTFVSSVDGEEIVRLPGHFGTVNTIQFTNDGKTIITGADDGYIRISPLTNSVFKADC